MGKVDESGAAANPVGEFIGFIEPYYPPDMLSPTGWVEGISQFAESTWDFINEGFMDGFAQTDAFSSKKPLLFELKDGEKDAFVFIDSYNDNIINR